jgi:hypothetical protein
MIKTAKTTKLGDVTRTLSADGAYLVVKNGSTTTILQVRDGVCVLADGQLEWAWEV